MDFLVVLEFGVLPTAFNEQPPDHDKCGSDPDRGDDDGCESVYPDVCAGIDGGAAFVGLLLNICHAISLFLRFPQAQR